MNQFIAVNSDTCIGCGTCLLACSEAHRKVGRQANPRLNLVKTRDVSATVSCHHCQGAPCALVCPVQAIGFDGDRVIIDEKNCISCKMCALTCPFGAIRLSGTSTAGVAGVKVETPEYPKGTSDTITWEIGVHAAAVKCDLCSFAAEGPSCARVCPTASIMVLTDDAYSEALASRRRRAAAEGAIVAENSLVFRSG
jgi:hydrogenase-4 component A